MAQTEVAATFHPPRRPAGPSLPRLGCLPPGCRRLPRQVLDDWLAEQRLAGLSPASVSLAPSGRLAAPLCCRGKLAAEPGLAKMPPPPALVPAPAFTYRCYCHSSPDTSNQGPDFERGRQVCEKANALIWEELGHPPVGAGFARAKVRIHANTWRHVGRCGFTEGELDSQTFRLVYGELTDDVVRCIVSVQRCAVAKQVGDDPGGRAWQPPMAAPALDGIIKTLAKMHPAGGGQLSSARMRALRMAWPPTLDFRSTARCQSARGRISTRRSRWRSEWWQQTAAGRW
jgi:hypothetical protein